MKGRLGNKVRTIQCAGCGRVRTDHLGPRQRYCSIGCYRRSARPGRRTGRNVQCAVCAVAVYLPRNRAERATHFFCSVGHANEWQARNKTTHICTICRATFMWSPSRQKANNIVYCSLACRDADPKRREQMLRMVADQQSNKETRIERIGYDLLRETGAA